jgi:peptidoglycan/LPS O-acetylase OafA/YrhL
MGILRLILAISVVVMHCDPDLSKWVLVGGQFAVKLFFIVSGFYMAMVLTEKYHGPGSVRLFYGNRLLRLLPTYYLVIAIALLVPWLAGIILHRPVIGRQQRYSYCIHWNLKLVEDDFLDLNDFLT